MDDETRGRVELMELLSHFKEELLELSITWRTPTRDEIADRLASMMNIINDHPTDEEQREKVLEAIDRFVQEIDELPEEYRRSETKVRESIESLASTFQLTVSELKGPQPKKKRRRW